MGICKYPDTKDIKGGKNPESGNQEIYAMPRRANCSTR